MPLEDANTYRFDPFDVTKVWSQKDYPLIELGRMVLNKNPENDEIKLHQIGHWYKADPECGKRLADKLGLSVPQ